MSQVNKKFLDAAKAVVVAGLIAFKDAIETMAFARELEHIEAQTYDIEYPELQARKFLPVDNSVPEGVETITYRQWDRVTMAKVIANYANDFPRVHALGREFTHKCVSMGNSFGYTVQDLRAAALLGRPVDGMLANIAREGHEIAIDNIAANGLPEVGFPGFLNHPNVPIVTLTTGTWATATVDQILEDLRMLAQSIVTRTKQTRAPNTILLPTELYGLLQKPCGANYGDTIMSVFLRSNPYIKSIEQWVKLDTAGADGGPRIVCYQKDPKVVKLQILKEFTQHAPQLMGLEFITHCESRAGGVVCYNPLAISYSDSAA
jgi:hypothetical protein